MERFRKAVLRHSKLFPASRYVPPYELRQFQCLRGSHSTLLFGMEAYLAKEETQTKFEERFLDLNATACKEVSARKKIKNTWEIPDYGRLLP